jgi:hypothetical protein
MPPSNADRSTTGRGSDHVEELGLEVVPTQDSPDLSALVLPPEEVDAFVRTLRSPEYASTERDYKVAVHEVRPPASLTAVRQRRADSLRLIG